jgi:hypothetical protein
MNEFYNSMPETPQQAARRQQLAAMLQQQTILPEQNLQMPSFGSSQMPDFNAMYKKKKTNAPVFEMGQQYSPSVPEL